MSGIPVLASLAGPIVLACIGLGFWVVYLQNHNFWWAIIPGGTMVTLALVAGISGGESDTGINGGGIFFLGLAATFALLGFLPGVKGMKWPYIPAVILAVMGLLLLATSSSLINYIWPIALVLLGIYLIIRSAVRQKADHQ